MKKILTLLFIGITTCLHAQVDMKNIEAGINMHATLIFPDQILPYGEIIISNNSATGPFLAKINRNNIFITATEKNFDDRTITVILNNGKAYTGILKYADKPEKTVYSFLEEKKAIEVKNSQMLKQNVDSLKMKQLMLSIDEYFSIGRDQSGVEFLVTAMRSDSRNTYFKITVKNNTALEYQFDGVIFRYDDKMKRKAKKKEIENAQRLSPICSAVPTKVNAYSSEILGFAIPLFATTDRGTLLIKFIEAHGNRTCEVPVPSSKLAKIKVF